MLLSGAGPRLEGSLLPQARSHEDKDTTPYGGRKANTRKLSANIHKYQVLNPPDGARSQHYMQRNEIQFTATKTLKNCGEMGLEAFVKIVPRAVLEAIAPLLAQPYGVCRVVTTL